MDNLELKNSLRDQKIPFDEAVRKKIEYLKSDDVFSADNDQYIMSMKNLVPSQQGSDPIMAAFGVDTPTRSEPSAMRPTPSMPQAASNNTPAQNRQMTMAERIAALRGALYVPKEFQHK